MQIRVIIASGMRRRLWNGQFVTLLTCLAMVALIRAPAVRLGVAADLIEPDAAVKWHLAGDFHRQLTLVSGIAWRGDPLRDALINLAREQRVAIFLDRRIDPDQQINFSARDVTLWELLQGLAEHLDIGVCSLENVVYFGPATTAMAVPVLSAARNEQITRLPSALRRKLERQSEWQWATLAEPRQLVQQLADQNTIRLEQVEQIPHDLWPAAQLPRLTLSNRLILVLAGFGMTYEIPPSRTDLRILPISGVESVKRSYSLRGSIREQVNRLREQFPSATIQTAGRRINVTGSLQDHAAISALLAADTPRREPRTAGREVHSLRVENQPVGTLVQVIAKQLDLEVVFDPLTQPKLNERVSFDVKNVSTAELFRAVLDPVGLRFSLDENKLMVRPAD